MQSLIDLAQKTLRFSERYTKTDMVYLAKGGFWLGVGQASAAVTAFAFSLIVARYVSPELYGSYKYVLSLVAIIGAFSLTGFGTSMIRSIATGNDGTLRYGFRITLLSSIPMLFGFAAVAGYYAWQGAYILALALVIAGIATPLSNAASLVHAYLNGKQDFKTHTLYWVCANIFSTLATIGAVLLSDNLVYLVGAYFISSTLANLFFYFIVAKRIPTEAPEDHSSLGYATHLSGINFLNTVSGNIDKIVVFHLLGTRELAIYTFALALPDQIRAFLKGGTRLALPRFAERSLNEIKGSLGTRLIRFGILIAIVTIIYIGAAPLLYTLLFPAYTDSIPLSQIMALGLITTLGSAPLAALQAHAKKKALYQHSIVSNVIQISSSVALIGLYGLWGAAFSVLFNRTIALALPLYLLARSEESTVENSSLKKESMRK